MPDLGSFFLAWVSGPLVAILLIHIVGYVPLVDVLIRYRGGEDRVVPGFSFGEVYVLDGIEEEILGDLSDRGCGVSGGGRAYRAVSRLLDRYVMCGGFRRTYEILEELRQVELEGQGAGDTFIMSHHVSC